MDNPSFGSTHAQVVRARTASAKLVALSHASIAWANAASDELCCAPCPGLGFEATQGCTTFFSRASTNLDADALVVRQAHARVLRRTDDARGAPADRQPERALRSTALLRRHGASRRRAQGPPTASRAARRARDVVRSAHLQVRSRARRDDRHRSGARQATDRADAGAAGGRRPGQRPRPSDRRVRARAEQGKAPRPPLRRREASRVRAARRRAPRRRVPRHLDREHRLALRRHGQERGRGHGQLRVDDGRRRRGLAGLGVGHAQRRRQAAVRRAGDAAPAPARACLASHPSSRGAAGPRSSQ